MWAFLLFLDLYLGELMMYIGKNKKIIALIGDPVGHSKSPVMVNRAFQEMGILAQYIAIPVKESELKQVIDHFDKTGVKGFNVTIPHKVEIMNYLDELDESAREIGAVNTVVKVDGKWVGFNTDGLGYLRSLQEEIKPNLKQERVLLMGAGGAARAVGYTLAKAGVGKLTIANRTQMKAEKLANDLSHLTTIDVVPINEVQSTVEEATLIINTTSVGMYPDVDKTPIPVEWMHSGHIASDLIYNPLPTKWLQGSKKRGARIHSGVGMLVHQAAIAIEHWFHRLAPIEIMKKALIRSLSEE